MRRTLAWALVTPLAAVGVLAGHAAAYALTGADPGPAHEYLAHAPQVLVVLVPLGLLGLACQQRPAARPSMVPFALLAVAGFAGQEHVEHLTHTGQLPWLLTEPTFLVGLVLQIPVSLACLALARRVLTVLEARGRSHRPPAGDAWLPLSLAPALVPVETRSVRATGRGPPGAYVP